MVAFIERRSSQQEKTGLPIAPQCEYITLNQEQNQMKSEAKTEPRQVQTGHVLFSITQAQLLTCSPTKLRWATGHLF